MLSTSRRTESRKPRIRSEEVRAEPQPESEVTEIHALQQERAVDVLSGGRELTEQALDRPTTGPMAFGEAARDEQQEHPGGGRPTSLGLLAVRPPAVE